jgi:hypothetical protein
MNSYAGFALRLRPQACNPDKPELFQTNAPSRVRVLV